MARALLILAAGIAAAVLLAVGIAGGRDLAPILGPVLVTTAIGTAVLLVVASRARLRERAEALRRAELDETNDGPTRATDTKDADRG